MASERRPTMSAPIDFYFDFSSPYGYLASHKIDALTAKHGRTVDWRPMLLGVVFKQTGAAPLTMVPLKGDYSKRDFQRSARYHGIEEFRMPSPFAISTQAPARIMLWAKARDPALGVRVAKALYRGYFFEGRDISNADTAADVAATAGVDREGARQRRRSRNEGRVEARSRRRNCARRIRFAVHFCRRRAV